MPNYDYYFLKFNGRQTVGDVFQPRLYISPRLPLVASAPLPLTSVRSRQSFFKHDSSTKQAVVDPQCSNPEVVKPISKQAPQKQQNRKQLKIDETGTSVFPCSRMNVRLKITNKCNYNNIL